MNVALLPPQTAWLAGWVVMSGCACRGPEIRHRTTAPANFKAPLFFMGATDRKLVFARPPVLSAARVIEFPVELASGSWIECNGPDNYVSYDSRGETLAKVKPPGAWPTLPAGVAPLHFSCEPGSSAALRAQITVFSQGDVL